MSKTILILDDEKECILSLKRFLDEFPYTVFAVMRPAEALQIAAEHKPALILFDYKMPEMDGDKFLEKARAVSPGSRYALMTAYRDDATIEHFKKTGISDVILKPVDLEKLLNLIEGLG